MVRRRAEPLRAELEGRQEGRKRLSSGLADGQLLHGSARLPVSKHRLKAD